MPKGPNGQKRPADVIGCAVHVAKIATGELVEDDERPTRGRAGAIARREALSAERRSEIAAKAAKERWGEKCQNQ
jgi:hypothetical protein